MFFRRLFYIFTLLYIQPIISQESKDFYTAAVVGYASNYNVTDSPAENIRKNSDAYVTFISQAANFGADIIVFPEYGLTSLEPFANISSMDNLLPMISVIPIEKFQNPNPCENEEVEDKVSEVVMKLSCAARDNRIYVVVNLPERTEDKLKAVEFYNTNIVFNRDGAIIARYRKFNLYLEPFYTQTKVPEEITFETDFGVKFGIFTCFDILFDSPAGRLVAKNITDFVYPTAWISEMPFLTALQVQSGWARNHNVNLLAADYVDPNNYFGGMGIFSTQNFTNNIPIAKENKMIIAKVPKIRDNNEMNKPSLDIPGVGRTVGTFAPGLHTFVRNLNYTYENLTKTVNEGKIMHGNFSCSYFVQISNLESMDYNYKIVAYQGIIKTNNGGYPAQICGVVACNNHSINSCGVIDYKTDHLPSFPTINNVSIEANFSTRNNTVLIPSIIDYDLNTLHYGDYSFTREETTKLSLNREHARLMTFGIIAHTLPNKGNYLEISKLSLLLVIMLFIKQLF